MGQLLRFVIMIGPEHLPYDLSLLIEQWNDLVAFEVWSVLMGSVLAFIIVAVSAFSVPLVHDGEANPVEAVHASVRTVFGSLVAWGLVLTGATVLAIFVLPMLTVVLPVLAYASLALYRKVFPPVEGRPA